MEKEPEDVKCENCKQAFEKENLERTCVNCFVCSGCEVYICPECGESIEVIPIKKPDSQKQARL
jgi:hypothetical protein